MKLKVSNYRPNRIIERDPNESTYKVGDDKFPTLLEVVRTNSTFKDLEVARRIVYCVNNIDLVVEALEAINRDIIPEFLKDHPGSYQAIGLLNKALAKINE